MGGTAVVLIFLAWGAVCLLQIAADLSDDKAWESGKIGLVALRIALSNLPFALFCVGQYRVFAGVDVAQLGVRQVGSRLLVSSLVAYVPMTLLQTAVSPIILGNHPWSSLPHYVAAFPLLYRTFDYLVFVGCFAATLAARIWEAHRGAERARAAALSENLGLRLALQQQQMRALQNQLEPHFLFNALNAISALVRGDNKRNALSAIGTLSQLLRYAVASSQLQQSSLSAELEFVQAYLQLQGLRFGDRFTYALPELPGHLASTPLPPLLLQPLVENAIRHDLERHALPSHIAIGVEEAQGQVRIHITNPLRPDYASNPGSGVGLSNVRDRLVLAFGDRARLTTQESGGQYRATLEIPKEWDD
jgi:sensor histidine kinase YesM